MPMNIEYENIFEIATPFASNFSDFVSGSASHIVLDIFNLSCAEGLSEVETRQSVQPFFELIGACSEKWLVLLCLPTV